ncbi:major facilitator superfamily domain-containing protein [Annulohypoxylon maeteangense]|uniref:major facilitator superfamily domain-containing protein n=1 Tax=Annulohypoxylon maeteangense TaxID=1927788 RepID=UPI0020082933|nr:major facilitator superfamily domain-containing protein [Annulohypoxylon maeteangense]KAI0886390.1 major facilitator superfamily domain-containing protein [Annulohypoxylon maeteangense]
MSLTQLRPDGPPEKASQPSFTANDLTTEITVSSLSSVSQKSVPKHTVSHDEATLVQGNAGTDGPRIILTEQSSPELLASAWPWWLKWTTLICTFLVQISMNLNASLYANAQSGIRKEFGVSQIAAVSGSAVFLVTYAFGCELWAPWSEEFGRKPVLQFSLLLVNLMCLPVALARRSGKFHDILIGRAFGGLFSAGGSVTLGVVADMYTIRRQEYPLAFIVLSSVGGSIIGPIIGGFLETYLDWTWCIWVQLIVGGSVQLLHLCLVPETRSPILLNFHAAKLRKNKQKETGETINVYGPQEGRTCREILVPKDLLKLWMRPFRMFATERIVMVLSTLSGFSDALIFMQIQSLGLVFQIWDFTIIQIGLAFISIGIGYLIGYLLFIPIISRNRALRAKNPHSEYAQYESRLWWLLFTAPLLPIGLLIFAWTSTPGSHWSGPMFGCILIGIANYTIYMTTIDYMVAAYGPYSASATGGNGFARDFLAGALTWGAEPYYNAFSGPYRLQIANTVLACISLILVAATYFVYFNGATMRKNSPFAQSLAHDIGDADAGPSTTI